MSAEQFRIKVYSPTGLAVEDIASEVKLQSSEGQIGVLPLHIDYTTILGTGVLEYQSLPSKTAKRVVIYGGFCTFEDDTLSILADGVDTPETVDPKTYDSDKEEIIEFLKNNPTDDPRSIAGRRRLKEMEAIRQMLG
jgi:F-type H+-transporting ATPase subunit epsilon